MPLLLIFILVPMAELAVLIKVGGAIGVLPTFGLIFLTAIIGVSLLRAQGLATLMRAGERMQQGALPAQELAEGFLLALAGALLLTPGFLTDAFGFSLLLPGARGVMAQSLLKRFKPQMMGSMHNTQHTTYSESTYSKSASESASHRHSRGSGRPSSGNHGGDVIEGDYKRED